MSNDTDPRHENVYKTTIQVVVFHEGPRYNPDSLAEVHYDIDLGDCVGGFDVTLTEKVPAYAVADELVNIGNDGTFFDSLD